MAVKLSENLIVDEKVDDVKKAMDTLLKNYQKRAEEAESALNELKDSLSSILNMNEDELKVICKEIDVIVFGRASEKHKYVCAYLNCFV
jgi:hypothetical protein